MSEREEDVGAELREAWRHLSPPPLPDAIDEADPATAAAVGWMRSAWRTLEAPSAIAVHRPDSSSSERTEEEQRAGVQRRRVAARLVALAALVLALLGVLWRALPRRSATDTIATPVARASAVEVLDVRPEQLELRSGPVRLVLVSPADDTQNTLPNEGS